jgi:hypothetical protein
MTQEGINYFLDKVIRSFNAFNDSEQKMTKKKYNVHLLKFSIKPKKINK